MTTNTGDVTPQVSGESKPQVLKETVWAFGLKGAYKFQGAWEDTQSQLTQQEQLELGTRICIEKNKESKVLADTLRNPHDPSRYVLQQAFHNLFQDSVKVIYDNMVAYSSETDELKKREHVNNIKNEVNTQFPPAFLDVMVHFYKAHLDKPGKNGPKTKEEIATAKKEFISLLTFQFASSEISLHANNDPKVIAIISSKLKELHKAGAFDGLLNALDERLNEYIPLPPVSEEFEKKVIKVRTEAYNKVGTLEKLHEKIYDEAVDISKQVQSLFNDFDPEAASRVSQLTMKIQNAYNPRLLENYITEIKSLQTKMLHENVASLSIEALTDFAKKGRLSEVDSSGKTLLEKVRDSGNYSTTQYRELAKQAVNADVKVTLDDQEQYAAMRIAASKVHSDEFFVFEDEIQRIEGLASTEAKFNAVKKLYEIVMDDSGMMGVSHETLPAINLFGGGTPEQIEKAGRKLQDKEGKPIEVTLENYEEILKNLKEAGKAYKDNYFDSSVAPEGKEPKAVLPLLAKPSPLHAMLEQGLLELPKDAKALKGVNIDSKNPEGLTLLQLAQKQGKDDMIPELVRLGANPEAKTTNYQRKGLTRFTDTIKGLFSGNGLKAWKVPPERSVTEIAEMSGKMDVVKSIQDAVKDRKQSVVKERDPTELELLGELENVTSKKPTQTMENDRPTEKRAAGLISRFKNKAKEVTKRGPTVEPIEQTPIQTQIQAIEKRLDDMKKTENYQLDPVHPLKIALSKEERLLTTLKQELSKDPIAKDIVVKSIEDVSKEMSKDASSNADPHRDLPRQTKDLLEAVQDALEPPRSTVGVKSGGK